MAPLVGLRIEKSESGALVVSRLPNRVKIDGRQFDFSYGPLRVRPDGTVADSADKSGANEESGDEVSSGALLGLAVRGDSNVKLSPKGGKINATAVSEGKIEVNGVKVGLESGTSILVGAGSGGDVELDEAETRVTLGREVFNLKGDSRFGLKGRLCNLLRMRDRPMHPVPEWRIRQCRLADSARSGNARNTVRPILLRPLTGCSGPIV